MERRKVTQLYNDLHESFIQYFSWKFNTVNKIDIEDAYHRSFIALHQVILDGKLTCSAKTFLFDVGYKQLCKYSKKRKSDGEVFDIVEILPDEPDFVDEGRVEKIKIVSELATKIGDICARVLNSFYWEGKSMQDIATELNYKTPQVAKNKKNRCFNSLKEMLIAKLNLEGLPYRLKSIKNEDNVDIECEEFKTDEDIVAEKLRFDRLENDRK